MTVEKEADQKGYGAALAWHATSSNGDKSALVAAQKLIEKGLSPMELNHPARYQNTPLMLACVHHHAEMADLLIKAGADLYLKNQFGNHILALAIPKAWEGDLSLVSLIISADLEKRKGLIKNQENHRENRGQGELERQQTVMRAGKIIRDPMLHETVEGGRTALMVAAKHGKLKIAEYLLSLGADINAQDELGQTALQMAKSERHHHLVSFFNHYALAQSEREALHQATQKIAPPHEDQDQSLMSQSRKHVSKKSL